MRKTIAFTHDLSSSSSYHLYLPHRKEFSHETLHIYQFGGEDENDIIQLHINYLICIKSIVLGQNFGKFGQKFPCNSSITTRQNLIFFSGIIDDTL
jgi:hypothetical protein